MPFTPRTLSEYVPNGCSEVLLSELTRRVLNGAINLAAQSGRDMGMAHVLAVIAGERRSPCVSVLSRAGLNAVALMHDLSKPRPVYGGRLLDLISRAYTAAEAFGSHYVGTDHLLLAMATDRRGERLLRKYGVQPGAVAAELRAMLRR
ncbi:MAG: hypothetical protein OHK0023_13650 [Anaerolineae bacterium]